MYLSTYCHRRGSQRSTLCPCLYRLTYNKPRAKTRRTMPSARINITPADWLRRLPSRRLERLAPGVRLPSCTSVPARVVRSRFQNQSRDIPTIYRVTPITTKWRARRRLCEVRTRPEGGASGAIVPPRRRKLSMGIQPSSEI